MADRNRFMAMAAEPRGHRFTPDSGFYRVVDTMTSITWEALRADMELDWSTSRIVSSGVEVWECYCSLLCPQVFHLPSSSTM